MLPGSDVRVGKHEGAEAFAARGPNRCMRGVREHSGMSMEDGAHGLAESHLAEDTRFCIVRAMEE